MQAAHRWRGLAAWGPLALATIIVGGLVTLVLLGPTSQPAEGSPPTPEVAAGFQTNERLTLTVNLPALEKGSRRDTLIVELIDPDGKILDDARKDVELTEEATSQRFELAAPKLAADKVTIRCRLDKQEHKVELKKILLVKAHETSLTAGKEFFAGSTAGLRCTVYADSSDRRWRRWSRNSSFHAARSNLPLTLPLLWSWLSRDTATRR
ncbi:MAG TPA: hypothetical protein VMG10_34705, partial [Gemmataceae bacterium]|nr:hypothetical protein [Gemmataceae bacterium]